MGNISSQINEAINTGNELKLIDLLNSKVDKEEDLNEYIFFAFDKGKRKEMEILINLQKKRGKKITHKTIIEASKKGRNEMIKYLLEEGVDVNGVDDEGFDSIFYSVAHKNWNTGIELICAGCILDRIYPGGGFF